MTTKEKLYLLCFLTPLISLSLLVILGRIVPRGGYNPWYDVMILYFIIITSSILLGGVLKKHVNLKYLINLFVVLFSILLLVKLKSRITENFERYQYNYEWGQIIKNIKININQDTSCIIGFEGLNRDETSNINIQLFKYTCSYMNNNNSILVKIDKYNYSIKLDIINMPNNSKNPKIYYFKKNNELISSEKKTTVN
jgi:hypothetical protein